ncbi:hypothetical protein PENARI_c008G10864 [Penicillium arizonense]|uniref:Adenosine deaminase domain-containing protein n=1 Tax=Penicillium arizonense TaxID=1835702 RepID=A0A1F5LIT6_PENAI|nr:hypothetical protein PENARI_c008G10864 [Penicillium arizonense]OGE53037.1 hypothetical protein PENARI_c008G10864 [Penicillium arizonense]
MNDLQITPFIKALPKVELHIHIEGTLTPTLRWTLAARNKIPLPYKTLSDLKASYAITLNHRPELNGRQPGIPTFLEAYFAGCEVLRTEADFYDLAMAYLHRCAEMNVRYTEPFFDIQAHTRRGVPASAVLDGYLRAQHDAVVNDDPTLMHDVWIDGNLQKVYSYCGFGKREMVQLVRNAVDMCWAGGDVKKAIHLELDGVDVSE